MEQAEGREDMEGMMDAVRAAFGYLLNEINFNDSIDVMVLTNGFGVLYCGYLLCL